jgi:hypothetical protein
MLSTKREDKVNTRQHSDRRIYHWGGGLAGIILLLVGLGLLVAGWLRLAWTPVWIAGLGLLIWGAAKRDTRLIISGGLLTGTGWAITIQTAPWMTASTRQAHVGLFLICLAVGWFLITLTARLAIGRTLWWPLFPEMALAVAGCAFLSATGWVQFLASLVGPTVLLVTGLFLIVRRHRSK